MLLGEYESRLLNTQVEEDEIQTYLDHHQHNFKIQDVAEAEHKIGQFLKVMKVMKHSLDGAKRELRREQGLRVAVERHKEDYF